MRAEVLMDTHAGVQDAGPGAMGIQAPSCRSRLRALWWREGVVPETETRPPRKCEQIRESSKRDRGVLGG